MKKLLALFVVAILALTGCSGASESSAAGGRAPADAGGGFSNPEVLPDEAKPTADSTSPGDLSPQIVRTAQVALRVPELLPAVARLRLLASSHQGQVTSEQLSLEEGGSATSSFVVIQVAAAQLDDALAAIGELGEVLSRRVTTDDVTTQVADIDARLRNLDASIARLTKLMDKAGNLGDLATRRSSPHARASATRWRPSRRRWPVRWPARRSPSPWTRPAGWSPRPPLGSWAACRPAGTG